MQKTSELIEEIGPSLKVFIVWVQGLDKRGRVRCIGKFQKCKKSKVFLAENEELCDRMKNMENLLTSVLALIQNRLSGEDLNGIMEAARRVIFSF